MNIGTPHGSPDIFIYTFHIKMLKNSYFCILCADVFHKEKETLRKRLGCSEYI